MKTIEDMERQNGQSQDIVRVGDVIVTWDGEFEYYLGEWSPVTSRCWWEEGSGPAVGSWFTGRNEAPGRDPWETRSKVVAASAGQEFAFVVGGEWVRWGYTFTPTDGGTEVTESWEMLPAGLTRFDQRFGDDAQAQIATRYENLVRKGIPETLSALKRAAESA